MRKYYMEAPVTTQFLPPWKRAGLELSADSHLWWLIARSKAVYYYFVLFHHLFTLLTAILQYSSIELFWTDFDNFMDFLIHLNGVESFFLVRTFRFYSQLEISNTQPKLVYYIGSESLCCVYSDDVRWKCAAFRFNSLLLWLFSFR